MELKGYYIYLSVCVCICTHICIVSYVCISIVSSIYMYIDTDYKAIIYIRDYKAKIKYECTFLSL